jgi:hypothetical protein
MDTITQLEDIDLKIEQWLWKPDGAKYPILNVRTIYNGVTYQEKTWVPKNGSTLQIGDLISKLIKQIQFKHENFNTEKSE